MLSLSQDHKTIAVIGAGKMGTALVDLWLKCALPAQNLTLFEPNPSADLINFVQHHAISLKKSYQNNLHPFDFVFLCVKPQSLTSVEADVKALVDRNTIIVSIMAGKTVSRLKQIFDNPIVRAMPNLPVSVGAGATCLFTKDALSSADKNVIDRLFSATGFSAWVEDETLIDKITALSGSGPAFCLVFLNALIQAGQKLGLEPALCEAFARQCFIGTSAFLAANPAIALDQMIAAVASKGGTTEAGLSVLTKAAFFAMVEETLKAAEARARELA